jgi:predicted amidohydrolase
MRRAIRIAGAQRGPIQKADSRVSTLERLIALLERAAAQGCDLVVFPFTTFFPHWLIGDAELDAYFERTMPNANVQPLFDRARSLEVGFHVEYAELTPALQLCRAGRT